MRFRKVIPCTFRQSTFPLEKKISVKNNEFILGDISKIKKLSLKTQSLIPMVTLISPHVEINMIFSPHKMTISYSEDW